MVRVEIVLKIPVVESDQSGTTADERCQVEKMNENKVSD